MAFVSFYNSPAWKALRKRALARDKYMCVKCGCCLRGKGKSRVDHIKPVKLHPELKLSLENLQSLCPSCDNKKHSEKARKYEIKEIDENGYPDDWR